jgi:hypothetical protein
MTIFEVVSGILWEEWDPLKLRGAANVPDEYDDYVPQMVALLQRGATEDEIAAELDKIYVFQIGSGALAPQHEDSVRAAKALMKVPRID